MEIIIGNTLAIFSIFFVIWWFWLYKPR